jgi:tRNA(Ile)-lysidine synthase
LRLRFSVLEAIRAHRLWRPGETVAVAVSGGLDSVALLDLLRVTARAHGGRLSVVSVDHGTRPESADDAAFVASLAAQHGLSCSTFRFALGAGASEDAARRARLEAFAGVPADVIALGHHRDDLVETALLGWLRGSGTRGMGNMAWRSGRRVRPLLGVGRDALRAWAVARGLTWRDDATNADPRYLRNRLRHSVLPAITALDRGALEGLARGALHAAADDAWLEAASRDAEVTVGLPDASGFAPLSEEFVAEGPAPLVRRALLRRRPDATGHQLDATIAAARRERARASGLRTSSPLADASAVPMHIKAEVEDAAGSRGGLFTPEGVASDASPILPLPTEDAP